MIDENKVHWFVYAAENARYTALPNEEPESHEAAIQRAQELAHASPGRWFGYGFWNEKPDGRSQTGVASYCWTGHCFSEQSWYHL